jgi:hypothetical protein
MVAASGYILSSRGLGRILLIFCNIMTDVSKCKLLSAVINMSKAD